MRCDAMRCDAMRCDAMRCDTEQRGSGGGLDGSLVRARCQARGSPAARTVKGRRVWNRGTIGVGAHERCERGRKRGREPGKGNIAADAHSTSRQAQHSIPPGTVPPPNAAGGHKLYESVSRQGLPRPVVSRTCHAIPCHAMPCHAPCCPLSVRCLLYDRPICALYQSSGLSCPPHAQSPRSSQSRTALSAARLRTVPPPVVR